MSMPPNSNYKVTIQIYCEGLNKDNDNIDVFVEFETGERYVATFFTISNIQEIMKRYRSTGECNHGQYFWASDMIIVEELTETTIKETIEHLLLEGEFEDIFSKCDPD